MKHAAQVTHGENSVPSCRVSVVGSVVYPGTTTPRSSGSHRNAPRPPWYRSPNAMLALVVPVVAHLSASLILPATLLRHPHSLSQRRLNHEREGESLWAVLHLVLCNTSPNRVGGPLEILELSLLLDDFIVVRNGVRDGRWPRAGWRRPRSRRRGAEAGHHQRPAVLGRQETGDPTAGMDARTLWTEARSAVFRRTHDRDRLQSHGDVLYQAVQQFSHKQTAATLLGHRPFRPAGSRWSHRPCLGS